MEVFKTSFSGPQYSTATLSSALVEGVIQLPEGVTADRIISCSGRMLDLNTLSQAEAVQVDGAAEFTVVFVNTQGEVDSVSGANGFSHKMRVSGLKQGESAQALGHISSAQARLSTPEQISVEGTAEIEVQHFTRQEEELICRAEEAGLQAKTASLYWFEPRIDTQSDQLFREEYQLERGCADIGNILRMNALLQVQEVQINRDAALIQGEIKSEMIYSTQEKGFSKTEFISPFTHEINVPGLEEDMEVLVKGEPGPLYFSAHEDVEGSRRLLALEAPLHFHLQAYAPQTKDILTDAWHTERTLQMTRKEVLLDDAPVRHCVKLRLNEEILHPGRLDQSNGKIFLMAEAILDGSEVIQGQVLLKGRILAQAYYCDESGKPDCAELDIPFETTVDWEGADPENEITAALLCGSPAVQYSTAGGRWMFSADLYAELVSVCTIKTKGLSELEMGEVIGTQPGVMVLCIAQDGEDLWDISKRCRVRTEDLKACNPELKERPPEPGSRIVALRLK